LESKRKKRRSRAKGIAETYIHIKDVPESLTKDEVYLYFQQNVEVWAKKSFRNKVYVKISIEDGSLIVRVLVGGLALANLVVIYGGFRSGIDHLVKDSRNFSSTVIEHFKQDEHVPDQLIIRAERRLGVPGKIQRFYKSIDKLNSTDVSHNRREEMIDNLKDEFISILELLEAEEDRGLFIAEVPENIVSQLPQTLPAPIIGSITLNDPSERYYVHIPTIQTPTQNPPLPSPNQNFITHTTNRNEDEE
jgi:hypothetical protein